MFILHSKPMLSFSSLILLDGIHFFLKCLCVYACLYVSTCVWRPKVDTECFPPPLYTFYIKERSLAEPRAHPIS